MFHEKLWVRIINKQLPFLPVIAELGYPMFLDSTADLGEIRFCSSLLSLGFR